MVRLAPTPFARASFTDPPLVAQMLPTDMALIADDSFRKYVEIYAYVPFLPIPLFLPIFLPSQPVDLLFSTVHVNSDDRERFFSDFAAVFGKLLELGVERSGSVRPLFFPFSLPLLPGLTFLPACSTTLRRHSRRRQGRRRSRRRRRKCEATSSLASFFHLAFLLRILCV